MKRTRRRRRGRKKKKDRWMGQLDFGGSLVLGETMEGMERREFVGYMALSGPISSSA
jgi:hypothetical protein